jgi:hypothetical protein
MALVLKNIVYSTGIRFLNSQPSVTWTHLTKTVTLSWYMARDCECLLSSNETVKSSQLTCINAEHSHSATPQVREF